MKIAVFGDSFTDPEQQRYPTWFSDYTSFGKDGSDVYYSYYRFLEHQQHFDKIIFAVTNPIRHSRQWGSNWIHFTHYERCDGLARNNAIPVDWRKAYRAAGDWFRHVLSEGQIHREQRFAELMIEDIKHRRPDTLFIKLFKNSPGENVTPLFEISSIEQGEIKAKKFLEDKSTNLVDIRMAHLTRESHEILKTEVEKALDSSTQWLDLDRELFKNIEYNASEYFVDINDERNWKRYGR